MKSAPASAGGLPDGSDDARQARSLGAAPAAKQAQSKLFDDLALEPVMPAQCDVAGQPALARPARDGVRGDTKHLRDVRTGEELRSWSLAVGVVVLHRSEGYLVLLVGMNGSDAPIGRSNVSRVQFRAA
jgi:hypothetical protein